MGINAQNLDLGEKLVPQIPYYSASADLPNNDLNNGPTVYGSKLISIGCNNNTLNQPSGMSYAYVFQLGSSGSGVWIQFCFGDQINKFYIRAFWNSWGNWIEL